jgi:hypothetical protein
MRAIRVLGCRTYTYTYTKPIVRYGSVQRIIIIIIMPIEHMFTYEVRAKGLS